MIIIYRYFVVKILYYKKYFDFVLNNNYKKISDIFFLRETITVAKDLLGKIIIRKLRNGVIAGKIVEVEAYIGAHWRAWTPKSSRWRATGPARPLRCTARFTKPRHRQPPQRAA